MSDKIKCTECGEEFDKSELVEYEGRLVCDDCGYELENAEDEEDEEDE